MGSSNNYRFGKTFIEDCNGALEIEVSSYRIANKQVVRITSDQEIQSVEEAIDSTSKYKAVQTHLNTVLMLLSNRVKPGLSQLYKGSYFCGRGIL